MTLIKKNEYGYDLPKWDAYNMTCDEFSKLSGLIPSQKEMNKIICACIDYRLDGVEWSLVPAQYVIPYLDKL